MGARSWLVGVEVALSTVLLVLAGLLATSLVNLTQVDKGFVVENVSTVDLQVSGATFPSARDRVRFYDQVLAQVSKIPSVGQVAFTDRLPLRGQSTVDIACLPNDPRPMLERPLANYRWVSPSFFETLGVSLREGRTFREGDRQEGLALVSEGLAREIWPNRDAIGQEFWRGDGGDRDTSLYNRFRVIGVVPDIRSTSLWEDPAETVYLPYWNMGPSQGSLMIRSRSATPPAAEIRQAIWDVAPEVPVSGIVSLEQTVVGALELQKFQVWLVGAFALSALLLASFGIYAVISQIVSLRTREIGVRMALGAARRDILKLVVRQGMVPSLIGLVAGSLAAIAASRSISHLLFGVSSNDLRTFLLMIGILLVVALAASYFPARRASRFDPMRILRQ